MTLVPIDYDNDPQTPSVSVAVDTTGEAYFLVLCNFEGVGGDKVFVVRDVDKGIEVLEGDSEEIRWTVTGGVVRTCGPLALGGVGGVGTL